MIKKGIEIQTLRVLVNVMSQLGQFIMFLDGRLCIKGPEKKVLTIIGIDFRMEGRLILHLTNMEGTE